MKKIILLGLLCCGALSLCAQKVFFIYIQSDTRTPFYIKMGEKVHSSSASGYLILSKLKDSTYGFQLGPSVNEPELRFDIPLRGNDRGFLLKKFSEGWGLFDLQSLTVISPANRNAGVGSGARIKEDRFTTLLAQAADDTSIFYQPVQTSAPVVVKSETPRPAKKEEASAVAPVSATVIGVNTGVGQAPIATQPKEVATQTNDSSRALALEPGRPAARDTVQAATKEQVAAPAAADIAEPVYKRSVVTRRAESSNVDGFGLVFWDEVDGVVDTIRLVIPNPRMAFVEQPAEEVKPAPEKKLAQPAVSCSAQAGDKDYFKLRRNLASVDSEADMTRVALEAFRKKCFTTAQIKNLSSLFLTQGGKFGFFEAVYPYTFDRDKFASLQSELFDATYISRFRALTSN